MRNDLEIEEYNGLSIAQRIPNIENRNLQTQILTEQRQFQSIQNDLDENLTKIQTLENHFNNVQDELLIIKKLIDARKNETETEEHMKMLNEREIGRLKLNISRIHNELIKIKDRKSSVTGAIARANQLINEMKDKIKWDEQALEVWLDELAQKDDDTIALMKYTKQDEMKVKELMIKIERMNEESVGKKRAVDDEILETTGVQVEFEKTASHFRRSHLHRQELIKRWENTIEQMHQRDRNIDLLAVKVIKIKAEICSIEQQMNEKLEFYVKEQRNNNERQVQISLVDRQVTKLRMEYDEAEKIRLLYDNELSGLRRIVERTEKDKETAYALFNQLKKQITNRRQYLDDVIAQKHELIDKKRAILNTKYTAEEKADEMDKLYLNEQEREMALNIQLKFLSKKLFKITQEIFDYQGNEKNLEAEINGSIVTLDHLQAKTNKLESDALKQHEVLYHEDFQIQSIERSINRMQGEKSMEEQANLERTRIELQSEMKRKCEVHTMLTSQTKQIQRELGFLKKSFDEISQEKLNEQRQIEILESHDDTAKRLLKKLNDEKENLIVDQHLMRVEVKRLHSLLNTKADIVINLESRQLQFQTVIKERRNEISINQSTLRQQIRDEEGRTSEISAQLHDRIAKIEKLKKRYQIANISMAPPEGFIEEETSQSYYVIKAAREKEELQRKGDELDGKNRKAEHELLALQNTLRIINNENSQIKHSFKKPLDPNEKKRQQILKLENECKDIERKLIQTDNNISTNKPSNRKQTESSIEENDFELRIFKEFNKKLDGLIDQIVSTDPDAKHCYNIFKNQSRFDEPSVTASTSLSVSSNSTRSSMSRTSLQQTILAGSIQLTLEGSRIPNGHRRQRTSSPVKRIVK